MSVPVLDLPAIVSLIVKVSVLLAAAAIVQALIARRASAATRHLVWTLVIAGALLLPVIAAVFPSWDVPVRALAQAPLEATRAPAREEQPAGIAAPTPAPAGTPIRPPAPPDASGASARITSARVPSAPVAAASRASVPGASASGASASIDVPRPAEALSSSSFSSSFRWTAIAFVAYVAGVLVMLGYFAAQQFAARRLTQGAIAVSDPEWTQLFAACAREMRVTRPVRLLRSREQTIPMVWGTRRPVILLPAVAEMWAEDRRRAVLLHEVAHVARHDCLTQRLAACACALYWMHPGIWWVARRLRVERELACDDRVLTVGTHARDYAGHLLELAYTLGGHRAPALVMSMARRRQLEGRMLAVLDGARNRTTPGVSGALVGLAITATLLVPLAVTQVVLVSAAPESATTERRLSVLRPGENDFLRISAPARASLPDSAASSSSPSSASSSSASASAASEQEAHPGTWEIHPALGKPGFVHLRMTETNERGTSSSGSTVPVETLEGLSPTAMSGAGGTVRFGIRRDAGTFTFEGVFRNGVGAGTYSYAPNPTFAQALAKRGIGTPTAAEQYEMARHDIGLAFVDELTKQGYPKPTVAELVRAGQHGVHLEYLQGMAEAGYRVGALAGLIELRDHGVTPRFIQELAAEGLTRLPIEQVLKLRDHGVSGEYVQALRAAGFGSLGPEQIVKARDHGVSAEFVRELGEAGYTKLTLDAVIEARDHGVSTADIRELRALGYKLTLPEIINARDHGVTSKTVQEFRAAGYTGAIDQIVKARDHGVSGEFLSELRALGYSTVTIDAAIRARDHGVSTRFITELKELGYDRLELDQIVELRDHGVTADRIRRANARAGTRLPPDMLKALADGGVR